VISLWQINILSRYNVVHFPCNYIILTTNQYQLLAMYYLFVGWFSDMLQPHLLGHLQGDFCNVCSVCFNLTVRAFTCDENWMNTLYWVHCIHSQCIHNTPNIWFHNLERTKKDRIRCFDMTYKFYTFIILYCTVLYLLYFNHNLPQHWAGIAQSV